jgi:glycolate oxidase
MKRIKDAFDPKGILNPGKIFVDDDPCTQTHVEEGFRVSH